MSLRSAFFVLFSLLIVNGFAQVKTPDSVKKLDEITVKGYYNRQLLLRSVSAVSLIDSSQLNTQNSASFVGLANTAAGVRMEERSPGSYRFSLRGSLLRSPFGIRNVKFYLDDFPLTDAGGNTYLNLIDVKSVSALEIYKGPEASTFGANTGGTVLISSTSLAKNKIELGGSMGSYGLLKQNTNITQAYKKYRFSFIQGHQSSVGYRENSAFKRNFLQTTQQWDYSLKGQLTALVFVSNLSYRTPGGLTAAQMEQNPKQARPATSTLPGAVKQQAAIYNKTIFGGISHSYRFNSNLKHVMAEFGSYTDFKNPFITNYEKRYENTLGIRTFIDYSIRKVNFNWNAQLGVEGASTSSSINNFNNSSGSPTSLQAKDDLTANQTFAFLRLNVDFNERLLIELGSSLNFYNYNYQNYFPTPAARKQKTFTNQLMPKLAASYLFTPVLSARATISKGYSPPTIAEVRSSDNLTNVNLQPEYGWNYEIGLRFKTNANRFYTNVSAFSYHLKDALVRRLNQNDTEYFINAGGTEQQGIEIEAAGKVLPYLQLRGSYTFSKFRFQDFVNAGTDYSGNKLTGVPDHYAVGSAEFTFLKNIFLFGQYSYASSIPLNDANTVEAKSYDLIDLKAGIKNVTIDVTTLAFFAGINNLLNKNYSLGNDLNAANGRYFNPSAKFNFYFGVELNL